jgi:hypothetical protein
MARFSIPASVGIVSASMSTPNAGRAASTRSVVQTASPAGCAPASTSASRSAATAEAGPKTE